MLGQYRVIIYGRKWEVRRHELLIAHGDSATTDRDGVDLGNALVRARKAANDAEVLNILKAWRTDE